MIIFFFETRRYFDVHLIGNLLYRLRILYVVFCIINIREHGFPGTSNFPHRLKGRPNINTNGVCVFITKEILRVLAKTIFCFGLCVFPIFPRKFSSNKTRIHIYVRTFDREKIYKIIERLIGLLRYVILYLASTYF